MSLWMPLLFCAIYWIITPSSSNQGLAEEEEPLYGYEIPEKNLIRNWDFEEELSDDNWEFEKATYEMDYSTYNTGQRSIRIKDRYHRFSGLKQKIYGVAGNTRYYVSLFIHSPEASTTAMYYMIRIFVGFQPVDGDYEFVVVSRLPKIWKSPRWRQLGADFMSPDKELEYIDVYLECKDYSVDFWVDTFSLVVIPDEPHWKQKAEASIRKHRQNNLEIFSNIPEGVPYCLTEFKLQQTKTHFGFGSTIQSDIYIEDTDYGERFRRWHTENFNWGVHCNTMKWKQMEYAREKYRFERVDDSIDLLLAQNMTIRGHAIMWGILKNNPSYVKVLKGEELRSEVYRRVDYVVDRYKGRVHEWDVMNEWLHGTWYDETINDPLIQDKIYNRSIAIDPEARYMMNDYEAFKNGQLTSAYADIYMELRNRHVPIYGIGMQSHLKSRIHPEQIKKRLDIVAGSGGPVVLTELSVHQTNMTERVAQLDEIMHIAYANPAVKAISLWQVTDQPKISFEPHEACFFEGDHFVPNEAGLLFQELRKKWQTNKILRTHGEFMYEKFKAYHGAYNLETFYNGVSIQNKSIYLHPGSDLTVEIELTKEDFPVIDDFMADFCEPKSSYEEVDVTLDVRSRGFHKYKKTNKFASVQRGDPVPIKTRKSLKDKP